MCRKIDRGVAGAVICGSNERIIQRIHCKGSVRHQGRFTRPSTDREVDRCNLQDDTVGAVSCGDRASVAEERQAFFIQSSTLKAQKLSSYLFAGDILYREVKKGYTRRQTSTWSASAYPTKNLRTAHSKP